MFLLGFPDSGGFCSLRWNVGSLMASASVPVCSAQCQGPAQPALGMW